MLGSKQKIKEKNIKKYKKRLIVIFTLVAVLISGFTYEKIGEVNDSRKYQPPGQLIEINGHKMHIYGEGISKNTPTVVFTSGWRTPSPYVDYYPLQKEISKYTRTVVYERPGYGWSEVADGERDLDTITKELHELLGKSGENGPYILVGHSFGSKEVLRFAQLYGEEVAGVVLLDGSNPDYTTTIKRPSKYFLRYGTLKNTIFNDTLSFLNHFGITRLLFSTTDLYISKFTDYKNKLAFAPRDLQELDEAMFIKTLNNKNQLQELRMDASILLKHRGIGDIPLKVITSSLDNDSELTRNIQKGLLTWSANSKQIVIQNSQHYLHWFNPKKVSSIIIDMLKTK